MSNFSLVSRWLYTLFIAIDANFRMKRKAVSSDTADPGLRRRWAYFIEEMGYKSYLSKLLNELQPLPCGVGDLQKGEKYINMDYLVFSALRIFAPLLVFKISYDIACQWYKHLWSRMVQVPKVWHINPTSKDVTFLVPKFHLPTHVAECHWLFSFNLVRGVGRTDGEAPERGWADINPTASSTKEMGPGSRHDTIDDHFGDWNWKKVINLGITILTKIQEAVPE
ncbi:hypothetical protein JVU11DRAFT_2209 [Chiua virens]|nr:hypothetical protein JVU11DRAFT_2209 [Chiua virens]